MGGELWVLSNPKPTTNNSKPMYAAKGGGVHPLKGIVSWVQNAVRQFV